jgi:hypothetical protein
MRSVPTSEANAVGIPKLDAVLYGTGYGPAAVTMADGEVLNGHYLLAVAALSMTFDKRSHRKQVAWPVCREVLPRITPYTVREKGHSNRDRCS